MSNGSVLYKVDVEKFKLCVSKTLRSSCFASFKVSFLSFPGSFIRFIRFLPPGLCSLVHPLVLMIFCVISKFSSLSVFVY